VRRRLKRSSNDSADDTATSSPSSVNTRAREHRLDPKEDLSEERWLLLGASFTHEYSLEAAAVCNPSIVLHPDQSTYRRRRAIRDEFSGRRRGTSFEHQFRTGLVSADGQIFLDPREPFPMVGTRVTPCPSRRLSRAIKGNGSRR